MWYLVHIHHIPTIKFEFDFRENLERCGGDSTFIWKYVFTILYNFSK